MELLTSIFTSSPFFQGGLALMISGWIGYQLRSIPSWCIKIGRSLFVRTIEIRERDPLFNAWIELVTDSALRKGGPRTLEVRSSISSNPTSPSFKAGHDQFYAKLASRLCKVHILRESGSTERDLVQRKIITIQVLFGTRSDLSKMLAQASKRANIFEDRQPVDICTTYGTSNTTHIPRRSPDTLCLPDGFFNAIESKASQFLQSRDEYERTGIPWRFGILLHGLPGTGKTTIAHTLASQLSHRLAVIPLSDIKTDEDLISSFEGIRGKSIVLLEDIDAAFTQRDNQDSQGISFSSFLNCIDGVLAPHNGRILIMTTNHIERLDPALIRPGRIDLTLEVKPLTLDAALKYTDRLFHHLPNRHDIVTEVMSNPNPTGAILINRIMQEDWKRTQCQSHQPKATNQPSPSPQPQRPTPTSPNQRTPKLTNT